MVFMVHMLTMVQQVASTVKTQLQLSRRARTERLPRQAVRKRSKSSNNSRLDLTALLKKTISWSLITQACELRIQSLSDNLTILRICSPKRTHQNPQSSLWHPPSQTQAPQCIREEKIARPVRTRSINLRCLLSLKEMWVAPQQRAVWVSPHLPWSCASAAVPSYSTTQVQLQTAADWHKDKQANLLEPLFWSKPTR